MLVVYFRVAQLITLLNEFHARICRLEVAKYDMEFEVKKKDFEVHTQAHLKNCSLLFRLSILLVKPSFRAFRSLFANGVLLSSILYITPSTLTVTFTFSRRFERHKTNPTSTLKSGLSSVTFNIALTD